MGPSRTSRSSSVAIDAALEQALLRVLHHLAIELLAHPIEGEGPDAERVEGLVLARPARLRVEQAGDGLRIADGEVERESEGAAMSVSVMPTPHGRQCLSDEPEPDSGRGGFGPDRVVAYRRPR